MSKSKYDDKYTQEISEYFRSIKSGEIEVSIFENGVIVSKHQVSKLDCKTGKDNCLNILDCNNNLLYSIRNNIERGISKGKYKNYDIFTIILNTEGINGIAVFS